MMKISHMSNIFCFFKKEKPLKLDAGTGEVAQWVRALAAQAGGPGFKPSALV